MTTQKTKLDIFIAVPGLPFNGETFAKHSLGGSETAGYYMARALARLGHRVTVFCNGAPTRCDDVDYMPLQMYPQVAQFTTHDVSIVQRAPELLGINNQARYTALWCHDLAIVRQAEATLGVSWNYDRIFVLSEFHREQFKKVYGLPDEMLFVTRNGVDLELAKKAAAYIEENKEPRKRLDMVFGARPERGLDVLLRDIFPRVLAREPSARLVLASYDNPVPHMEPFYNECKRMIAQFGDRVVHLGHLNKEALYRIYNTAGLYVYPTPSPVVPQFEEISCISAMEAQACGLPFLSTARGALPETVARGAGVLLQETLHTPQYFDTFAQQAVRLMKDDRAWAKMSRAGREAAEKLDWQDVATQWESHFVEHIRARSADKATLLNHFWRRSDIYAARELMKSIPADDLKSAFVRERIQTDWPFLDEEDGFRKQYEKIGLTHTDVFAQVPHEPRFQALKQWLAQHPEVKNALDYGCAHGGYALNMAEQTGIRFTGLDIDKHSIAIALKDRARYCKTEAAKNSQFFTLDEFKFGADNSNFQPVDAAIAFEVLEHVSEPWTILEKLEAHVKDGGFVVLTVPFGPWEYASYKNYPHRCHVWEFDLQDMHDLLDSKGKEGDVRISAMPGMLSQETGEPLGWWFCVYKVTSENRGKIGRINMERKLWLQRPRETVSASIIAGPGCEETLLWHLHSLEHVADEIVVVDCGLSSESLQMLAKLDAAYAKTEAQRVRVIPNGPDPKTQGFETPRNVGLEHCTQDWVLWIDTDEKLMQPEALAKYLRPNAFQAYSIQQHHFAVDTNFTPDMPARLFRNNGKLRFFGMIHEHPEETLNKGPGRVIVIRDAHIAHVGYLHESGRRRRFQRNLPMLQADIAKYPERKLQKHFIMRDNMLLVMYELQNNGQHRTPEIDARCRQTIELWREHFMGKGHFSNSDPIEYYSQALGVLGEGFSFAFNLAVDKAQAKPNGGGMVVRFANVEDMGKELGWRAKEMAAPFENPYW